MESLFHFIFELVKIAALACFYSSIVLLFFIALGYLKSNCWFDRMVKDKYRFWSRGSLYISIALFVFMWTYWGDHGLGDNSVVPVGHFKTVEYGGGAHITPKLEGQVSFQTFAIDDKRLYASSVQKSTGGDKYDFLVWNLSTDEVKYYPTEVEYMAQADLQNFPKFDSFHEFDYHYSKHWNGWRLWFLP
ncbi:MAG: hypothetical protein JWN56_2624 [Sphingobacteriales bacterium]|nr:hypothetical protein [Sphingobacteriales bacterium]